MITTSLFVKYYILSCRVFQEEYYIHRSIIWGGIEGGTLGQRAALAIAFFTDSAFYIQPLSALLPPAPEPVPLPVDEITQAPVPLSYILLILGLYHVSAF